MRSAHSTRPLACRIRGGALVALALTAGLGVSSTGTAAADEPAPSPTPTPGITESVYDPGVGLVGIWQWIQNTWTLVGVQAPQPGQSGQPGQPAASRDFAGKTLQGDLTTSHWPGQTVHWIVATPQGPPRGTVIVLHGKTDTAQKAYDQLRLTEQAQASGYALAAIDGGSTYWTNYNGIDTAAMVIDDFLPLLGQQGLPVDRVGLTGYSMGGLGALLLAEQLGPDRVLGVAPMSAAVWEDGKPGAEGHAQQQVRRDVGKLAGIPVSIASGTDDSLTPANQSLAAQIPHAHTEWTQGAHDFDYWRPTLTRQLQWLAAQAQQPATRSPEQAPAQQPAPAPQPTGTTPAPAPTAATTATPEPKTPAGATQAEEVVRVYTTGYTFGDNTPADRADISHPVLHQQAGGTGTYDDPITAAVGHDKSSGRSVLDIPAGTRLYFPDFKRYFLVEDTCGDGDAPQNGPCHNLARTNTSGVKYWIDLWLDGRSVGESAAQKCAGRITAARDVIMNPGPNHPVASTGPFADNCDPSKIGE